MGLLSLTALWKFVHSLQESLWDQLCKCWNMRRCCVIHLRHLQHMAPWLKLRWRAMYITGNVCRVLWRNSVSVKFPGSAWRRAEMSWLIHRDDVNLQIQIPWQIRIPSCTVDNMFSLCQSPVGCDEVGKNAMWNNQFHITFVCVEK